MRKRKNSSKTDRLVPIAYLASHPGTPRGGFFYPIDLDGMHLRWIGLLLVVGSTIGGPAAAQPWSAREVEVLRGLNAQEHPSVRWPLRAADATAYPVFYAAPAVAWGIGWLQGDRWEAPYRLSLAWAGTAGSTLVIKNLVRRPRPFVTLEDITVRVGAYDRRVLAEDSYSFPSGHAALSFALATSVSLSSGTWYVAVPSLLWASGVSVSRVWLGVHYPSDVLAGAVLGAGIAVGVHLLQDALTPGFLEDDEGTPIMTVRIRLP